jgi:hypothetical protein
MWYKDLGQVTAEEKNAENLLIIKSKELANRYLDNWIKHKEHSYEYKRKQ